MAASRPMSRDVPIRCRGPRGTCFDPRPHWPPRSGVYPDASSAGYTPVSCSCVPSEHRFGGYDCGGVAAPGPQAPHTHDIGVVRRSRVAALPPRIAVSAWGPPPIFLFTGYGRLTHSCPAYGRSKITHPPDASAHSGGGTRNHYPNTPQRSGPRGFACPAALDSSLSKSFNITRIALATAEITEQGGSCCDCSCPTPARMVGRPGRGSRPSRRQSHGLCPALRAAGAICS
jgi:hypothetical protein